MTRKITTAADPSNSVFVHSCRTAFVILGDRARSRASSAALAKAIVRQVLASKSGTIVELGPGAITTALLDLGISPDSLYLVDTA